MPAFYDQLPPEMASDLDRLSRVLIELRESRAALLARYGVDSAAALAEGIGNGTVAEHPAYEDYLGVRVIEGTRDVIRAELRDYLCEIKPR